MPEPDKPDLTVTNQYGQDLGALRSSLAEIADKNLRQMGTDISAYEGQLDRSANQASRGIGDLETAQRSAMGERQKLLGRLEDMARDATGGRKAAFRDLVVGLSAIGRGNTLGQGAGIAGEPVSYTHLTLPTKA